MKFHMNITTITQVTLDEFNHTEKRPAPSINAAELITTPFQCFGSSLSTASVKAASYPKNPIDMIVASVNRSAQIKLKSIDMLCMSLTANLCGIIESEHTMLSSQIYQIPSISHSRGSR